MNIRILQALSNTIIVAILFVPFSGNHASSPLLTFNAINNTYSPGDYKPFLGNGSLLSISPNQRALSPFVGSPKTNAAFLKQAPAVKEKSKGKAFLFSMLIPGAGEYYVGRKFRAKSFFMSELALWITFGALRTYGDWNKNEYKIFARTHAGANTDNKKHRYFVDLGNFNNIYEYNDYQLNERELEDVYPETKEYFWQWDNAANRDKFERMRIRSDNAYYRALFVTGIIFVNHLGSAIDAIWVTHKHNKTLQKSRNQLNLHLGNNTQNLQFWITFRREF